MSSEALLVDRHGAPLSEVRANAQVRRLDWVTLADVSPALSAALVAAEDKRFWEHDGVDWTGLAVAAWDSMWRALDGRRPRGGSTLTMQLAGLLDPALRPGGADPRTLAQKWDQIEAALALERTWRKGEILEAYLNLSSFRGELTGLRAAARGLFGKEPDGLDAQEAAVLVALLRAPGAKPALVAQRACAVAAAVAPDAACEPIRALASVALAGGYRMPPRVNLAPHLAAKAPKAPGARIATTLDAELQAFAIGALRDHLAELAARGVGDGALVVLDNATGDVLAYVGSSGDLSRAAEVDGVVAPRQAGSTLKPFLYALALDAKLLTAASLVDDSPLAIATARGMYVPQNYDRDFRGSVSVRTALASSLNVPAVRTLELVGGERFHESLRNLGFDTLTESADYYGASLALGGADVTLLALANAYRALANGGVAGPPRVFTELSAKRGRRRARRGAAPRVRSCRELHRDGHPRGPRRARPDVRARESARDARLERGEDRHVQGHARQLVRGLHGALHGGRVGRQFLRRADARRVGRHGCGAHLARRRALAASRGAVGGRRAPRPACCARTVAFDPPVEHARREWFVAGTAMPRVRATDRRDDADGEGHASAHTPRIRYPAPDTVIALDPDIPAPHQRVAFVAAPAHAGLRWQLDDAELPDRGGRALWAPTPGRHVLVLVDADGTALSRVDFDVRGHAPARIAAGAR